MPLPPDYDSPQGEADAEKAIRGALVDCFLAIADPTFGFDSSVAHDRMRYLTNADSWEFVSTIVDPDTAAQPVDQQTKLTRYFALGLVGFQGSLRELKFRYALRTSFGFKDAYKTDSTRNSSDELYACMTQYQKFLRDNLNLGLDDRVSHEYLQLLGIRFVLKDKQGNAMQVADSTITVVLEVC